MGILKDGFYAQKMIFQDTPGYRVVQVIDCEEVCSQFIPDSGYVDFCRYLGFEPVKVGV